MSYLLATTENRVRWYRVPLERFDDLFTLSEGVFELLETLDLNTIPGFGNKATAKHVAKAIGLKTWRYVKMDTILTYTLQDTI